VAHINLTELSESENLIVEKKEPVWFMLSLWIHVVIIN